ncbi:hypothetical protein [Oceanirhabdus seepicola]|uniref:Uncharacterized protein n=1 Tax=Oceanirhabdus seepicola TaxID=2828781 RepID=A0A9J6P6M1_9CLOT|nr:hypothetical protein [Oceanirhabdus seepicola]MCM1991445.1 hypothetical protein [Oceanirhabdus seepicola]
MENLKLSWGDGIFNPYLPLTLYQSTPYGQYAYLATMLIKQNIINNFY